MQLSGATVGGTGKFRLKKRTTAAFGTMPKATTTPWLEERAVAFRRRLVRMLRFRK